MRFLVIPLAALALTGCATQQSMYQWGSYDSLLYQGYKEPSKMEAMKVKLQAHIDALEKSGQKVGPGLYAELGTLYLEGGASDKAVALYSRERDAWPESKGLMTSMITNIERRQKARAEIAK
jgi:hypothetical protein